MDIFVSDDQKDLCIDLKTVPAVINSVLSLEKREAGCVSISFVSKRKISSLHKKYFNDPTPTDCISFPIDEDVLGEVVICPKVALDYVAEHGGDVYEEVTLYVVHGLLHLLGYDDMSVPERKKMRLAEKRHMKALSKRNIRSD